MTLNEFAVDFLENALIGIETGLSDEEAITKDILEYIQDSGEILEPQLCHFKIRGIKINAADYNNDNESIDLFATICKKDSKIQKVSDGDVLDAFERAEKFFRSSLNGSILDKIDESDQQLVDFVSIIQETKSIVKNVRLFVLTNGLCSAHIVPQDRELDGVLWDFELWDIERIYQQYLIRAGKQKIEVDFEKEFNFKLKCLIMDNVSPKVDEYLTILPAKILAEIYGRYKQGLLEKNIRNFLQFRAKVNNGIRETLRTEPDMFFAYNNGISTTAESIDIGSDNSGFFISRIENLQIVNGGQTTASIYHTSNDAAIDLSSVFVPMKISVVKPNANMDDVVPKISQFANSQTAIKDSDFSSNSIYHLTLEKISRSKWIPVTSGGKAISKWYYERTRGQYLDQRSRIVSKKDQKGFDIEYPKKQKFSKLDLSKYEMSWWQRPHDVSKGAEKHFDFFLKEIEVKKIEVDEKYYHNLIAKAILFNAIDKTFLTRKMGGYKAVVNTYVLSWLSYKTEGKLNFDTIWEKQEVSEAVLTVMDEMISIVWAHITTPSKASMNITDWHKKLECWTTLKDKFINISILSESLKPTEEKETEQLSNHELEFIEKASVFSGEAWFNLAKWAKDNNLFTPFDRKLAHNFGILKNRKVKLSVKQAKNATRIMQEAKKEGFVS